MWQLHMTGSGGDWVLVDSFARVLNTYGIDGAQGEDFAALAEGRLPLPGAGRRAKPS